MPNAPITPTSAKGTKNAVQEGLVRESSGMPMMISPLTSISNSMTLPTPRQRIVHPIRSDSRYVGLIEILQPPILSSLGEDHGCDGLGFGTGGWGGGIGPVGVGVGSVGPGLGSVGGGLASCGRMMVAVAVGALAKQPRINRLIATTLRIRFPHESRRSPALRTAQAVGTEVSTISRQRSAHRRHSSAHGPHKACCGA